MILTLTSQIFDALLTQGSPLTLDALMDVLPVTADRPTVYALLNQRKKAGEITLAMESGQAVYAVSPTYDPATRRPADTSKTPASTYARRPRRAKAPPSAESPAESTTPPRDEAAVEEELSDQAKAELFLKQAVRSAGALVDETLQRALSMTVPAHILPPLAAASRALHDAMVMLLVARAPT